MILVINASGADAPISIRISPIEMEMGTGVEVVLLELHELLKLYNPSSSAGADASGAVLLELLMLYNTSFSVGAGTTGSGSEGMETGTISGITDLRYSSLAARFQ